jgi:hypothetical protein
MSLGVKVTFQYKVEDSVPVLYTKVEVNTTYAGRVPDWFSDYLGIELLGEKISRGWGKEIPDYWEGLGRYRTTRVTGKTWLELEEIADKQLADITDLLDSVQTDCDVKLLKNARPDETLIF